MKDNTRERQQTMPGVGLDSGSSQLDELLSELLNDANSSSKDSKRWGKNGSGDGLLDQPSGSITTQSGNSRTIISWQTSQSGPKKPTTVTKQLTGISTWNGEPDSLKSKDGRNWTTGEKIMRLSSSSSSPPPPLPPSSNAVQYQKGEYYSSTLKQENALNSKSSLAWKEDRSTTLGKTAKTPPPPPVRRRLTSADELRMNFLGGGRVGGGEGGGGGGGGGRDPPESNRPDSRNESRDLIRNCASDSEETRSWLDEQIWKLQSKKSGKSYQQHTRLEKQLIADLKNRLGLGGQTTTQSDIEDGLMCLTNRSQMKMSPPSPPQRSNDSRGRALTSSASFDEVIASKTGSSSEVAAAFTMNRVQSDTDDNTLTSSKDRTSSRPPNGAPQTQSSSTVRVLQAASDNEMTPTVSAQSTLRRSLSHGDESSSRPVYKAKASFFVSGIERPAFSTHQTKYTFSVNPLLSEEPQNNNKLPPVPPPRACTPTSPLTPKRGESSREAVLKSQRKLVCSPSFDELESSLRLIMEQQPQTHSSAPDKDVVDQRKVLSPMRDVDEELIILRPIGPGIQTLEPDSTGGTLRRPMTPLVALGVNNNGEETLRKNTMSPVWTSAENINPQQGQSTQQSRVNVQYSSETIKKKQQPNNAPLQSMETLGSGDNNVIQMQQQPWQQQTLQQQQFQQWQQQQQLQQSFLQQQQQQPWQQQQLVQQPLSAQQQMSLKPQPLVQSWQQQSQPWPQQQQQSWQQMTWQQKQQSWPVQQPLLQPVQQPPVPSDMLLNQPSGKVEVTTQTTEFVQQGNVVQQPGSNVTQQGVHPLLVSTGMPNNQQFDRNLQQGNNLFNQQQNQEIFVQQSAHQDVQKLNTLQRNLQLEQQQQNLSSQQFGVQQFGPSTLNAQPMNGQQNSSYSQNGLMIGGQNHIYRQNAEVQQFNQMNRQLVEGQMVGGQSIQQSNTQQVPGGYQTAQQFNVNQGGLSTGVQQDRSRYVTVEQTASTLSRNGTLQPNRMQVSGAANMVQTPQQMQLSNAQNQEHIRQQQLFQQEQLQQMQQLQSQRQQQAYSGTLQSSFVEQTSNGRQGAGSSMTLDNRTKSPIPLGSPTSIGSWPSMGYNDTLRSQTLQVKRTGSNPQAVSYETLLRTRSPSLMRAASPASIYNGQFRNGSLSSLTDGMEFANTMPRFVRDTSKHWHKPNISREEAINMLKDKPPGSFVVRNSTTFQGGFGLALKVAQLPPNVQAKGDDLQANLVRHFLIESNSKGVRLKGCSNEPVFGSLAALIYQHSITPLALPCKLHLPMTDAFDETDRSDTTALQSSLCSTFYVESVDTESLTGPEALSRAVAIVFGYQNSSPKATPVQFKVSNEGITLTDSKHRLFFRRHYPLSAVSFCGLDGNDRRLILNGEENVVICGKIFGFVARKSGGNSENACHLFLDPQNNQSGSSIVDLVTKVMMGQGQFMKN